MKQFFYPSHGAGRIKAWCWEPETAPVGVVQIVHGVAEHMGRYEALATWLAERGYLVVGEDHMGHGGSVGTPRLNFGGDWFDVAEDTFALYEKVHGARPALPYFILGHSMGSFLTRTLLYTHPEMDLRGVILCGTGWQPGLTLAVGRAICALECRRLGETAHSPRMERLMFGAYNRRFRPNRTPNDWICSDPAAVDAYTADPLCGGETTLGLTRQMLRGMAENQKKVNLARMKPELPALFIAGKEDPVGAMGAGVERTARAFTRAGMRQVRVRLFDGRHEIHQEKNRGEVYEEIDNFLAKWK